MSAIIHIGTDSPEQTAHLLDAVYQLMVKGRKIAVSPTATAGTALLISRQGRGEVTTRSVKLDQLPPAIPLWGILHRGINALELNDLGEVA